MRLTRYHPCLLFAAGALLMPSALASGKELHRLIGHEKELTCIAFSPDGKTIATGSDDRTVRLWEVATGKQLRKITGAKLGVCSVAFSPDGSMLAWSSYDGAIRLLFPATGKELHWHAEHNRYATRIAFAPDSKTLASGGEDGQLMLWSAATGKKKRTALAGHPESRTVPNATITSLCFSSDGKTMASGSREQTARLWDVATGQELRRFRLPDGNILSAVVFAPDNRTLFIGGLHDPNIHLIEIASGQERCHFQRPTGLTSLALSPDGRLLASAGVGGFIHLWDVASGINLATRRGHTELVSHIAFSPDGTTLVSASYDKTARLWDVSDLSKRPLKPVDLPAEKQQALWEDLAGEDAGKAHRAIWTLAADEQTTAFLGKHLKPSRENNRPDFDRLLCDLDDDRFAVREKAQRELEKLGSGARPALLRTLQATSSPEVRKRIKQVLERLKEGGEPPEVRRTLRGIEVLELIGSPEARQVLEKLAQGAPGTASTEEARASCRRLKNRRPDWPDGADHP